MYKELIASIINNPALVSGFIGVILGFFSSLLTSIYVQRSVNKRERQQLLLSKLEELYLITERMNFQFFSDLIRVQKKWDRVPFTSNYDLEPSPLNLFEMLLNIYFQEYKSTSASALRQFYKSRDDFTKAVNSVYSAGVLDDSEKEKKFIELGLLLNQLRSSLSNIQQEISLLAKKNFY
ncbi:hypothetical protein [Legionella jordanis]|uniref:Transmembrane protein n=1 Tax=Legionella jordanis TaxID=456 RepID=A0A0W0VG16_9GAMM|nr:hypothetical protein [Legionella jordanis]KTD19063.1 hypothetical protein Ljor_0286 [Legionella jordanis]RMX05386.1 hypothetical protein EAW55_01650 [Legionella jordanis]VEH13166.1 Uncharacterised protein [Legionella jordanis]